MKTTVELAQEAGVIEGFDTVHPSIDRLVALVRADERKQVALDKKAENARELGLDYEPTQEPVYVKTFHGGKPWPLHPEPAQEPLFTYDQVKAHIQAAMMSAAQRQWVGLTEDERDTILRSESSIFDMTEAILKAKNT